MRRTNSKEVKAAVRNYLTEVAQSEELNTIKDIKNKFINEYGWAIARLGERNACIEWLRGLGVGVDYSYYDIIQLMAEYEEEREEIETEIIVYTIAPEYRFDEDIKGIIRETYNKISKLQEEFEDLEEFEDSLDECDNNTEILQALASKIGKQELTEIVAHYDYHLEWAINQILK